MAYHLVEGTKSQLGHHFPYLSGNEAHEIDDVRRVARELRTKFWVLGCDTHGASVEVTRSHHHTAERNQRCCGKAKLFCSEQRCCNNVSSSLQLSISLQCYAATEIVEQQCLMGLSESEFPRFTGVLYARQRCRTGATVVTANENDVSAGFGYSGGNCSNTNFGNQLHADSGLRVCIFQIVD